jgi:hypothetical protein
MDTGEKIATGVLVPLGIIGVAVAAYFLYPRKMTRNKAFDELIKCSEDRTPSKECIDELQKHTLQEFLEYRESKMPEDLPRYRKVPGNLWNKWTQYMQWGAKRHRTRRHRR